MQPIKWLVIALLTISTAGLLAFGPRAGRSLPKDRVIVDYWEKWSGNEEAQMRGIVDEFNRTEGADRGIFVRYSSMATVYQRTLVATAAGVPPDIAGLFDFNLVQFAAMNALEPLEDLAREHGIDATYYKPVYWNAINYNGHLYALISTPAVVGLHYNKRMFAESAPALRAAGLDPDRPPRTLDELDRYAKALTTFDARGHITRVGFLPMEPNWFINYVCFWFGANYWDESTKKFNLTDPAMLRTYQWIESYSRWLGKGALYDFQSGFGNFDSPQNAFLAGQVAMELQGPWMANFIYKLKPSLSTVLWPKDVEMTKPLAERQKNYEWAVAPFPSAVPGLDDVTYCGFDTLTIPVGAKHKREAFEFIAYLNRQDVMEKLCGLHCKSSPLAKVSDAFIKNHPNPYVGEFERLTRSPNARAVPQIPIMPEVLAEFTNLWQQVSLLEVDPAKALADIQTKLQAEYDEFARAARQAFNGVLIDILIHLIRGSIDLAAKRKENLTAFTFLLPWLIGLTGFILLPIGMSLYYSFCSYSLLQSPVFTGMANYRDLMHDPIFWKTVWNTAYYAALALPLGLLISLGLAVLLNVKIPGQSLYRTLIFLPSLVPAAAGAMLWLWLFNSKLGLVNLTIRMLGIHDPPAWLADVRFALPALALMSCWGVGNTVVVFLAGLQDVPRELYEAADLDGANKLQSLFHVTLPSISPVIFFNLIMGVIAVLQIFTLPYIMTQGGPARATYFYTMYVYDNAFQFVKMGYASAMAWIQLLMILALTGVAFWSSKRWVHYEAQ